MEKQWRWPEAKAVEYGRGPSCCIFHCIQSHRGQRDTGQQCGDHEWTALDVTKLRDTDFPNENYRSENLKEKLQKKYNDRIAFCNLGTFKSSIIYNRSTDIETAIKRAYILGSRDMIQDCGVHLHEVIINVLYFQCYKFMWNYLEKKYFEILSRVWMHSSCTFWNPFFIQEIVQTYKNSEDIRWPPMAQDLRTEDSVIPQQLHKFLSCLLFGKPNKESSKQHRLVESIGQVSINIPTTHRPVIIQIKTLLYMDE